MLLVVDRQMRANGAGLCWQQRMMTRARTNDYQPLR
jgi:hypothetical protein